MATGIEDIPDWAQSCPTGKRKYPTAKDVRNQNKKARGTILPYRCPHCDYFHLTTTPKNRFGRKHA